MLALQDKFMDKLLVYYPPAYQQAQYLNQNPLEYIHLVNPYPQ